MHPHATDFQLTIIDRSFFVSRVEHAPTRGKGSECHAHLPDPRTRPVPSPILHFWMNHRYTFAEYYSALFIILSILRCNRIYHSVPVYKCTASFCLPTPPSVSYFIWSGTFLPNAPRYFRQQIYSTDIYEGGEEEIPFFTFEEEAGSWWM